MSLGEEAKNGFVLVEVELEEGSVSGWIRREVLNREARDTVPDEGSTEESEEETDSSDKRRSGDPDEEGEALIRPRSRIKVPRDEAVLLRRDPTFFYGLQAGGGLAILQADTVSTDYFLGPAFGVGGHVGYHITPNIPVRFELGYWSVGGSDPKATALSFGFLDGIASVSYLIQNFELFGGLQFAYGISVGDLPRAIANFAPPEFSSFYLQGGAGYRFRVGDVVDMVVRTRYHFSFLRNPVAYQAVMAVVFLEFRG